MNEPPSVAVTQRFLSLCEYHGSQHLVVKLVAVGCRAGVAGYLRATTGRPGTQAGCGPRVSGAPARPITPEPSISSTPCSPGSRQGADPPGAVAPGPREFFEEARNRAEFPRAVNTPRVHERAGGRGSWSGKVDLSHFVAPDRTAASPTLRSSARSFEVDPGRPGGHQ